MPTSPGSGLTAETDRLLEGSGLREALILAVGVHFWQKDKQGQPAAHHILRVSKAGATEDERIVGALHDVVEDTDITLDALHQMGFAAHIVQAIDAITRRATETYAEYIDRLALNPLARLVKLNDLADNMNRGGSFPTLMTRYAKAEARLRAALPAPENQERT